VAELLQLARNWIRFDKRWFFIFYLLLGLPYLILTGPFRAPDERNHFLRSYEISEGRLQPYRVSDEVVGDALPASLTRLSDALGSHSDHHIDRNQIKAARQLRLLPEERQFAEFSTAIYSPLAYVPSALAIAVGRLFGAGPFALVYFARCGNLLVGSWLITMALSYSGFARRAALLIALFPMVVSQIATVTADAMSYGVGFLWVALLTQTAVAQTNGISRARMFGFIGLALALSQLRPPYPFLGLLVFLIPAKRIGLKVALPLCAAVLAACFLPALAWNANAAKLYGKPPPEQQVEPAAQLKWVGRHPGPFWHRVKQDLRAKADDYWQQLVGRLGWLNISLPAWIPIGFLLALTAAVFLAPRGLPVPVWWQRGALTIVVLAGIVAVEFALYVTFNKVGSRWIFGVQGRYFAPVAFVAAFAFSNSKANRPQLEWFFKLACVAFLICAHFGAFVALARAAGKIYPL
jgi:uncharacterized membrane protein